MKQLVDYLHLHRVSSSTTPGMANVECLTTLHSGSGQLSGKSVEFSGNIKIQPKMTKRRPLCLSIYLSISI